MLSEYSNTEPVISGCFYPLGADNMQICDLSVGGQSGRIFAYIAKPAVPRAHALRDPDTVIGC